MGLRRRCGIVALLMVLSGAIQLRGQNTTTDERLAKGPVIQNVQSDRATISWVTHRRVGQLKKEGATETIPLEEPQFHHVELQGLESGVRYTYSLEQHGAAAEASFTTAPAPGTPFTFVVYGDTRTRHDVHTRAVSRVIEARPAFVLHMGDLVANGLIAADWDRFFEIEKELLRIVPFFPTLGNHERNAPFYYRMFSMPGGDGDRYSFDWSDAHFATINTNELGTTPEARAAYLQAQVDWLKEDLRRNKKLLTFVYFHHPLYTAVEKRTASAARLREKIEPALIEGGVTAVLAGHDHNYQHHLASGIHHIVSGGGGAPLYDVTPIPELTIKAQKIDNYIRIRVEGGKAMFEAFDLEGNLLESFEVQGRGSAAVAAP
jgi:hypothetical protein